jgi:hypothetical protein
VACAFFGGYKILPDHDSRPAQEFCPFSEPGHLDRDNREPRS